MFDKQTLKTLIRILFDVAGNVTNEKIQKSVPIIFDGQFAPEQIEETAEEVRREWLSVQN